MFCIVVCCYYSYGHSQQQALKEIQSLEKVSDVER